MIFYINILSMSIQILRNVLDIKKTFFEHFLSSKMGRGILAVAGGSGGPPIFDPKSVQIMFLNVWDIFLTFLLTYLL